MRPFFPYYGSKWNIARHYPKPLPGEVVEPFAGAAGYSTFYNCPRVRLIDKDPVIVGVWSYLLHVTPAEIMALPELPEIGDSVDNYVLPQEVKWLIGFWLNRGSATPKKSRTGWASRQTPPRLDWGARAKERIASQLRLIEGWQVELGSYEDAPDEVATWFYDPPYGDKGKFYRVPFNDFDALGHHVRSRRGLVIACEAQGADWLPFQPLGSFKSTKGRAAEMIYVANDETDLFARTV